MFSMSYRERNGSPPRAAGRQSIGPFALWTRVKSTERYDSFRTSTAGPLPCTGRRRNQRCSGGGSGKPFYSQRTHTRRSRLSIGGIIISYRDRSHAGILNFSGWCRESRSNSGERPEHAVRSFELTSAPRKRMNRASNMSSGESHEKKVPPLPCGMLTPSVVCTCWNPTSLTS